MHPQFQDLTPHWFKRAYNYTGSIGDFRYRFTHDDSKTIHAAVYSKVCYEMADDVVEQDFPWTDQGVRDLQQWVQAHYETFISR